MIASDLLTRFPRRQSPAKPSRRGFIFFHRDDTKPADPRRPIRHPHASLPLGVIITLSGTPFHPHGFNPFPPPALAAASDSPASRNPRTPCAATGRSCLRRIKQNHAPRTI